MELEQAHDAHTLVPGLRGRSHPRAGSPPRGRRGGRAAAPPAPASGTAAPTEIPLRALGRLLAAWVGRHAVSLPIVLALLGFVAVVLGTNAGHFPALGDDEGTYVAQAWSLRAHGALAHYTYWYDHPPLGWVQLALASAVLSPFAHGHLAVIDGRTLMLLPALASSALVYVLARRLGMHRAFAAVAVLLFALSPLAVSSLRMVYLDNIATPWILAAFVFALSPRGRLWAYAGSGFCIAVAILTKETSVLALPGLLLQVRLGLDRRTRAFCFAAFASVLVLVALGYPLYALLKGELLPGPGHVSLLEAFRFQLYGRASTGSALSSGSLSRGLVDGWLRGDAWLLALGIASIVPALLLARLRPLAVTLLVLVVVGLRPGYLPQPYVIALLPFCALLFAGVADSAWAYLAGRGRPALRVALAALLVALAVAFAPAWYNADRYAARANGTGNVQAAETWVVRHVDHRARVLVDDTLYVDLVRSGFGERFGAVWFYKLDFTTNLDPSVARHLPQGWRAFDYVVSTPVIRSALTQNPAGLGQVRQALRSSSVVRTFGTGSARVELRRVTGSGTGSGRVAAAQSATPPALAKPAPSVRHHPTSTLDASDPT